jgi:hypothetical protein
VQLDLPDRVFKGWVLAQTQTVRPKPDIYQVEMVLKIFQYGYYLYLGDEKETLIGDDYGNPMILEI